MTTRSQWLNATIREGLRAGVAYSDMERELAVADHDEKDQVYHPPANPPRANRDQGWARSKQAWARRPEPKP